jgi:hypothetical protein
VEVEVEAGAGAGADADAGSAEGVGCGAVDAHEECMKVHEREDSLVVSGLRAHTGSEAGTGAWVPHNDRIMSHDASEGGSGLASALALALVSESIGRDAAQRGQWVREAGGRGETEKEGLSPEEAIK